MFLICIQIILTSVYFPQDPAKALYQAFQKTQEALIAIAGNYQLPIVEMSGCTASVVLSHGNKIYMGHVGDSRIMYITKSEMQEKVCTPGFLSQDHKPEIMEERQRIESSGGEVRKLPNDHPYRVYLKGHSNPGLAMSRALGDLLAHTCGVTNEPEVVELDNADGEEGYIVIASDGVWEFTRPEVVGKLLKHHKENAPEYIAQKAYKKWLKRDKNNTDDITVLVLSLIHI
eukprot:TRINITY_DN4645_c0_g1_i1.p2 TRINITY_DN4645_c0_g1~~TRINITY_DN4645_c0_g1_i1.p2  ORF type:complete len:230 (-),score=33.25 TRINITY_DN4645_c0_g1_i1:36-725(-)